MTAINGETPPVLPDTPDFATTLKAADLSKAQKTTTLPLAPSLPDDPWAKKQICHFHQILGNSNLQKNRKLRKLVI